MNNTAIITVGVSASGKSSFAQSIIEKDSSFMKINRDGIRRSMFKCGGWSDYVFSEENERAVTFEQERLMLEAISQNKNIIITDMNLRMKYIRGHIRFFTRNEYDVKIKFCHVSVLETLRRQNNRTVTADSEEIKRQHALFEQTVRNVKTKYFHNIME